MVDFNKIKEESKPRDVDFGDVVLYLNTATMDDLNALKFVINQRKMELKNQQITNQVNKVIEMCSEFYDNTYVAIGDDVLVEIDSLEAKAKDKILILHAEEKN